MTLSVQPGEATLGATVTGVDLGNLPCDDWDRIAEAFLDHAVLIFPGQRLSEDEQGSFARRFGPLDDELMAGRPTVEISNVHADGSLRSDDHPVMVVLRGNEGWHTDSSYMPVSAKASVLSAHRVPHRGGETEWADMRAAHDALDATTRELVADLAAYHSLVYSQARSGNDQRSGYGIDVATEPLRPLVKVHPESGRPALFIGRHAHDIVGLGAAESTALLDRLLSDACGHPRVLRHRWEVGDVVIWDNRCVLHRALPYDPGEARVLAHTRVAGGPTEAAVGSRPIPTA